MRRCSREGDANATWVGSESMEQGGEEGREEEAGLLTRGGVRERGNRQESRQDKNKDHKHRRRRQ